MSAEVLATMLGALTGDAVAAQTSTGRDPHRHIVPLMNFPPEYGWRHGLQIARIVSPTGMARYMGSAQDWKWVGEGKHVIFVLFSPQAGGFEVKVHAIFSVPKQFKADRPWIRSWEIVKLHGTERDAREYEWSMPYWLSFAAQMIWPEDFDPFGSWGPFDLPWWLPGQVWDRGDDWNVETQLHALHAEHSALVLKPGDDLEDLRRIEDQIEQIVGDFTKHVFEGFPITGREGDPKQVWADIAPPNAPPILGELHREDMMIAPVFEHGKWFVMGPEGYSLGEGHTFLEALSKANFDRMGLFMDERKKEQWWEDNVIEGEPLIDPAVLEPYFLLGEPSPLLMPHEMWMRWYETVRGA